MLHQPVTDLDRFLSVSSMIEKATLIAGIVIALGLVFSLLAPTALPIFRGSGTAAITASQSDDRQTQ